MPDFLTDFLAKKAREDAEYEAAWQKAVDKLSITFEANQPLGGWPHVLVSAVIAEERLRVLRDLGFRVLERWEMDDADPGEPPNLVPWVRISGNILVNLAAGFVIRSRGVRT